MHPLTPDLSKLTDTELQTKITELGKKIMAAMRTNSTALVQMQMLYQDYLAENRAREDKKLEEMLKANSKSFDDIIDIG